MGPVRGQQAKRRKKIEKQSNGTVNEVTASEEQGPVDWWEQFSRRIAARSLSNGPSTPENFESVFKISRKTFNYICSLVDDIMSKGSNFVGVEGNVLTVKDQVAVALKRLSSGDSLVIVGDSLGVSHSTVSQVTWRFIEAMEARGLQHLRWPNSEEMNEIKAKFERIRGLPNCCGAIDLTHIIMNLPVVEASKVWLDNEENYSMILQAIVDPDMRFRDVVTGWPGNLNELTVLKTSTFYKLCEMEKRLNGPKVDLTDRCQLREYIIGDSAFPLLSWLVTPYQGKDISNSQAEFNKRHFATRMVAHRAFSRLKEMWKIIQGAMWRPDKHKLPRMILVCCMLHNIIIDMEDEVQDEMPLAHQHDTGYKQCCCTSVDKSALVPRDELSHYLSDGLPP